MDPKKQYKILFEVLDQREKQEIFILDYTPLELLPILTEKLGKVGKQVFDSHFTDSNLIKAYTKLADYRQGLVDMAAVLLVMIENVDQNKCDECGQLGCICITEKKLK